MDDRQVSLTIRRTGNAETNQRTRQPELGIDFYMRRKNDIHGLNMRTGITEAERVLAVLGVTKLQLW